jgi:hypothetical protein
MSNLLRLRLALIAVAALTLGLAPTANATQSSTQSVTTTFAMPVSLNGTATAFDCANSPGPWITFEGTLTLDGVSVEFIFRNQRTDGAPHERTEDIEIAQGVALGETLTIPKQPSHDYTDGSGTGVGGNPFIWIQLVDGSGKALSDEIYIGRCVQGPIATSVQFGAPASATALVDVVDCTNNPGPFIYMDGSATLSGISARFIFRNNDNKVGGPHEASKIVSVPLVSSDWTLQFPKQPVQGGVGGNPWISVQFATGSGAPVGNEFLLGRCVQLLPGN